MIKSLLKARKINEKGKIDIKAGDIINDKEIINDKSF